MSPLPKTPAYGDSAKLEQVASGTKQTNGTYGPLIQRNPAGRPTGTGGTPAPRESKPTPDVVRPEHKEVFDELAQAELVRQQWAAVAAESPTPWVQGMKDMAERNFQAVASKAYNVVPNSEF